MAKRNNNVDQTPIDFSVSSSLTGRGPRIPIPINQPNWKYKTTSTKGMPGVFEWIAIVLIITVVITSIIALITKIESSPLIWIVVVALSAFLMYAIYSTIKRVITYSKIEDNETDKSSQKRMKKPLKRRKDYK